MPLPAGSQPSLPNQLKELAEQWCFRMVTWKRPTSMCAPRVASVSRMKFSLVLDGRERTTGDLRPRASFQILSPWPGIGNGVPLAAVVTTPEIAQVLASRIYLNTFGGNPVVCAQGRAVLQVIDREGLQDNSLQVGNHLRKGFHELAAKHNVIGDVRGKGLMLGIELVKDRTTKEPAKEECARVFETAKDLGLLVEKGGLFGNTLRIKPPMCITHADADFMLEALDVAFGGL